MISLYRLRLARLSAPLTPAGKTPLTDFCNRLALPAPFEPFELPSGLAVRELNPSSPHRELSLTLPAARRIRRSFTAERSAEAPKPREDSEETRGPPSPAIPPQVEGAFDGATSSFDPVNHRASRKKPAPRSREGDLAAALSTACDADHVTSDARRRPHVLPSAGLGRRLGSSEPEPLLPRPRQRSWVVRLRAPFIDEYLFQKVRHSSARRCHRAPSFRLAFTSARSRDKEARPSRIPGSSPGMRREATRRSPTSAIETAREHAPRDCSNPACAVRGRPRTELSPSGWQVAPLWPRAFREAVRARPTEVSWVRGRRGFASMRLLRRRSLAFPELFPKPNRLGHFMSRARDAAGRWCRRYRRSRV